MLETDSVYCRFCGAPIQDSAGAPRRLTRLPDAGRVAGVCAGLAVYFGIDVTVVRLAWVILAILPGVLIGGLAAYLVAWLLIPAAYGSVHVSPAPRRELRRSGTNRKVGGVCGGLAVYFGVDATAVRLIWALVTLAPLMFWPGGFLSGVLAYAVAWFVIPDEAPADNYSSTGPTAAAPAPGGTVSEVD